VGIQGGNKPTDPAVSALLPIIRKTSILTDKDIRPLGDPHHIYFVQEVGAFPLRLIEGMEQMRTLYRAVSGADQNPLHTHQDSRQFQDHMPETLTEIQAKQHLILAQALGLVAQAENTVTGYSEVRMHYQDKLTGLAKTQVLGGDWQEAEDYLITDQNRKVREVLEDSLQAIGQRAVTKPEKQSLYQKLMAYLKEQESTLPGGRDNAVYRKQEGAIEEYVKTYSLFIGLPAETPSLNGRLAEVPATSAATPTEAIALDSNLEKFSKLVETCYRRGNPSNTELQLLERFRNKYAISQDIADGLITKFTSKPDQQDVIYEFGLMYRAFLENDGEIDLEEQSQLLELQEELGLTDEQVSTIEANVRDELGLGVAK